MSAHWSLIGTSGKKQTKQNMKQLLWYVSGRAIFGAGISMGKDDGYYCDVLSSGVNLFLVQGSPFCFTHWSFIVQDLLAVSWQ